MEIEVSSLGLGFGQDKTRQDGRLDFDFGSLDFNFFFLIFFGWPNHFLLELEPNPIQIKFEKWTKPKLEIQHTPTQPLYFGLGSRIFELGVHSYIQLLEDTPHAPIETKENKEKYNKNELVRRELKLMVWRILEDGV